VAKLSLIYGLSLAVHGALALSVALLKEPKRTETIAITMSDGPKKPAKVEPAKVVETPKPSDARADAPRPQAKAKVAPAAAAKPNAPPPPAKAAAAAAPAGNDALPDLGLAPGNGDPGGMAIPQGPAAIAAAAPSASAKVLPARVLAPRPAGDECADPPVKPRPKSIAQPAYTSSAREANVEGKVRVEVSVDDSGHVTAARLLAGLGYGLDEAALEAARRAELDPDPGLFRARSACFQALRDRVERARGVPRRAERHQPTEPGGARVHPRLHPAERHHWPADLALARGALRVVTGAFRPAILGAIAASSLLAGCTPELDDRGFQIAGPRLLAIAATPAEAEPRAAVTFRALYVDAAGERGAGDLEWAFCTARKPLTEPGTVSSECGRASGPDLEALGSGAMISGALPDEGCRLFGPDRPAPVAGEPVGRAVDPDPSGGFYQPVRLRVSDGGGALTAIGAARLACGISGAAPEQSIDFVKRYRRNENPAIAMLAIVRAGSTTPITPDTPGAAAGATVARGERVTLRAAWDACPTGSTPESCAGAEQYLWFDPEARVVALRREAIRVSWFTTAGTLAADSSGRAEDEAASADTDNAWTAPDAAGEARIWLVVRDDRGGVGWQSYRVRVR
jgi:TonB family protein